VAAMLRIHHPYGGYEDKLLLPGSHRIGSGRRVEIMLPERGVRAVHAILEWGGLPELPQLRPLIGDGSVRIDGEPVLRRTAIPRGAEIRVGPYRLELTYPEG
jgi:serine/threonine-protein kinase